MNNKQFIALVVGLLVVLGAVLLQPTSKTELKLAGTTHFSGLTVSGAVVASSTLVVEDATTLRSTLSVTGATTLTGETTLGNCGTALYTIPALSPAFSQSGSPIATTSVTVTGAALGDVALVSNNSTTQALAFYGVGQNAVISAAGTATVMFFNASKATSTAVTTSTVTVCYFD